MGETARVIMKWAAGFLLPIALFFFFSTYVYSSGGMDGIDSLTTDTSTIKSSTVDTGRNWDNSQVLKILTRTENDLHELLNRKDYSWVGTLIAVILGLAGIFNAQKFFTERFWRPNLKVAGNIRRFRQGLYVWRIPVVNMGQETAVSVEAMITAIRVGDHERENFLPMPLAWTHVDGSMVRDIHPEQTVYLDIVEQHHTVQGCPINIASPRGHGVSDFRDITPSEKIITLEIAFFERRGMAMKTYVELAIPQPLFMDARIKDMEWLLKLHKFT